MSALPERNASDDPAPQPLQIVGAELAITLNDARAVLEQYAEGEGSPQLLERCAALLHTARGVLQITETWGASLLAEEMEQTCRHLLKSRRGDGHADDGIEALSRAAVQLPGYVDRIRDGSRDVPLVLLPLLNDLRAARGRPLLSESTLLLLNIAPGAMSEPVAPPAPTMVCISSINKITSRFFSSSFIMAFMRSSNWPRYLVPATKAARSSITMRLSNNTLDTLR